VKAVTTRPLGQIVQGAVPDAGGGKYVGEFRNGKYNGLGSVLLQFEQRSF